MREKMTREIEKEYGVSFGEKRNMKLSTWLKKRGLPSMARAYKRIVCK